ncbi:Cathepsin B-like peptidase 4 [Frankliniella occidentalis]|uniref:Cathepsin B-like n=1 Tax=Frankliniella occidentalis TaxID=133901 RepID=A0A6J1T702_FRAOC|nr:cathepsin B-like [Frankliniella occidentalis]KAE8753051.1 Cathepsin B-like peptidase 4 [Frankliniella occidentalis]
MSAAACTAILFATCGAWLRLLAAADFNCATLSDTPKPWQHARIARPPPYYEGVILNPVFSVKMSLDARLFDDGDAVLQRDLPESFDARRAWPHCPSISKIVNQGCCGSCWAYASAMAMTDRQCIHGHEHFEYSAEHLLHCSKSAANSSGCQGGDPAEAFDYWAARGVVSGGPFNSSVGCAPYTTPPSGPHCLVPASRMDCPKECQRPYPHAFNVDRRFGDRYHLLPFNRPVNMQAEIMRGGPIVVILDVYEDFKCYSTGVYQQVAGVHTGAHAVRLIGWGTENGVPYWLAANTWGIGWGDKGFFKIRRGVGECKIEGVRVVSGYPVTSRLAAAAAPAPTPGTAPPPPPN